MQLARELADGCSNIVIACVDFRKHRKGGNGGIRPHIEAILGEHADYDLLTAAGACFHFVRGHSLVREHYLDTLELVIGGHGVERVVLVQHTACAQYARELGFMESEHERHVLKRDLVSAEEVILERFPNLIIIQVIAVMHRGAISHLERITGDGTHERVYPHPHYQRRVEDVGIGGE